MAPLKKLKLQSHNESSKPKRYILNTHANNIEIYVSNFCVTDNKNFAVFNANEQFLIDKGFNNVLDFTLLEDDLWMLIDRKHEIEPDYGLLNITFSTFGAVNRKYFNIVVPPKFETHFYPVTEWFGKSVNRLIACLPNRDGKPFGVLKTIAIKEVELK